MASPQIENGYTRVATELLEAWSEHSEIPLRIRILFWVLRNTYGVYDRKKKASRTTCRFTWTAIAADIRVRRTRVSPAGRAMIKENILRLDSAGNIGIQKDREQWVVAQKGTPPKGDTPKWDAKKPKRGHPPAQMGTVPPTRAVSYRNVVDRVDRGTTAPSFTLPNGLPDTPQARADAADHRYPLEEHRAWARLPFKRQDELTADWRGAESRREAARIKLEHDQLRKQGLLPP